MSKLGTRMNGTQKHKPDVDVVCVEPLGNSSQNPLRECVEAQTSP